MPPPFLQLTPREFGILVDSYHWKRKKTEIHMHHTWRPDHASFAKHGGKKNVEAMYHHHTANNGWSDIGQHITIAPDGAIWTGRDRNRGPVSSPGHNQNYVFMFEMIGNFDTGQDLLQGKQLDTTLLVIGIIQRQFSLSPWSLKFHRQWSSKTCPGTSLQRGDIIKQVDGLEGAHKSRMIDALSDFEMMSRADQDVLTSRFKQWKHSSESVREPDMVDLATREIAYDAEQEAFMEDYFRRN